MTIMKYTLIRSLRNKSALFALWVVPTLLIFLKPLWQSRDGYGFALYGLIILYTAYIIARSMMKDRVDGVGTRVYAAPVTTFQYLFQSLLAFAILLFVQILLVTGIGAFLYGWSTALIAGLILCYTVFAGTSLGFVIAWHSLFRRKDTSDGVFSVVASFIGLLGGVFVPIAYMPQVLQRIGMLMPTYWLSYALMSLQQGSLNEGYWLSMAILIMFLLVFLLMGSRRRFE